MSSPEALVREVLLADPVISGAVGGTRIYPLVRPQGSPLPAITYQRVSQTRADPLVGRERVASIRLQIDCWSAKYADLKTLAQDVSEVLHGHGTTDPPPALRAIRALPGERDDYDEGPAVYRVSSDYSVWWEEG